MGATEAIQSADASIKCGGRLAMGLSASRCAASSCGDTSGSHQNSCAVSSYRVGVRKHSRSKADKGDSFHRKQIGRGLCSAASFSGKGLAASRVNQKDIAL